MVSPVLGYNALFPRRRRNRPDWNQQHDHEHHNYQKDQQERPHRASPRKRSLAFFVATACLLVVGLVRGVNTNDGIHIVDTNDEEKVGLRRRLLPSSGSKKDAIRVAIEIMDHEESHLRYLSFGGPLTYGRGLEKAKRTSEAYPYLLSSAESDRVHNVAYPSYETMGPTMASLCTQSIVEDSLSSSADSEEYDVITLEYSLASANALATPEAFLSSIQLLIKRLRQRYPLARILLVQLWTPSDLIYHDTASNRTVSYEEWRGTHTQQQKREEILPPSSFSKDKKSMLEPLMQHAWRFRELSRSEQEIEENLGSTMESHGCLIYKLPRSENINKSLNILKEWFLEEWYVDGDEDNETNDGSRSLPSLKYSLSKEGHAAVAKGIRKTLEDHPTMNLATHPAFSQQEVLYSWGSGDSCHLWYNAGKDDLPNPSDHSSGLQSTEIDSSLNALEVRTSGILRVHNPFDTEKMIYLTYLTTSETAASNKVYPKTRVRMVAEDHSDNTPYQEIAPRSPKPLKQQARSPTTSVILDPAHGDQGGTSYQHHRTRTSAVGLLPPRQTGILEFSPLEEYTIHSFRIVGVSILYNDEGSAAESGSPIAFEYDMFSPRRLSVATEADTEHELESEEEALMQ
jgi:hypothetical protein